ncbi:hypothetical protein [Persicobacter diffluens]|uniref:hypothetical protein n=1 Tax=Persicobacter diffluens TaxID=981 RepID=UPI0030C6C558
MLVFLFNIFQNNINEIKGNAINSIQLSLEQIPESFNSNKQCVLAISLDENTFGVAYLDKATAYDIISYLQGDNTIYGCYRSEFDLFIVGGWKGWDIYKVNNVISLDYFEKIIFPSIDINDSSFVIFDRVYEDILCYVFKVKSKKKVILINNDWLESLIIK